MTSFATPSASSTDAPSVKVVVHQRRWRQFLLGRRRARDHRAADEDGLRRAARVHAHDRRPRPGDARLPAADHRGGRRRLRRRRRDHRDGERHPLRAARTRRPRSCSPASDCPARTWAPARSCRGSSATAAPPSCCSPAGHERRRRSRLGLLQPRRRRRAWRKRMRSRRSSRSGPTIAHAVTKRAAPRRMARVDRAKRIEMEARGAGALHGDQRLQARLRAFAAKQKPVFKGN